MQKRKNVWHQYQIVLLLGRIRLETYLLPRPEHPRLLWPPGDSPFHGCRPDHGLLVLAVVLLVLLGIDCWRLLGCFLWTILRLVILFSTVEACTTSYLCWGCLAILVGSWGRKTSYLVVLTLVLISSRMSVLTVLLLLLLRKLPLVLVLVLTLMLVLMALLELLWRVA
jgi:hypothetical protein